VQIKNKAGVVLIEVPGDSLRGANLTRAVLRHADLAGADLRGANLTGADLCNANLYGADLRNANLRYAKLRYAVLAGVDLTGADLRGANLTGADLHRADLPGADLTGADLRGANLTGAVLAGAGGLHYVAAVPAEGSFKAWKKLLCGVVCELLIPADARRTGSYVGRKCRASKAVVVSGLGVSLYDELTHYAVGATVVPDSYDPDPSVECTNGVHFFMTRKEAEVY